jgi:hypothetical protein
MDRQQGLIGSAGNPIAHRPCVGGLSDAPVIRATGPARRLHGSGKSETSSSPARPGAAPGRAALGRFSGSCNELMPKLMMLDLQQLNSPMANNYVALVGRRMQSR